MNDLNWNSHKAFHCKIIISHWLFSGKMTTIDACAKLACWNILNMNNDFPRSDRRDVIAQWIEAPTKYKNSNMCLGSKFLLCEGINYLPFFWLLQSDIYICTLSTRMCDFDPNFHDMFHWELLRPFVNIVFVCCAMHRRRWVWHTC